MHEALVLAAKMLAGGTLVVCFALIGQAVKPKTLAGIFAAAPSVAIASLAVTTLADGQQKAVSYCAGMLAGAVGLLLYCAIAGLTEKRLGALRASLAALPAWVLPAGAIWLVALR